MFFNTNIFCQYIIPIDSIIGDTIELSEKIDFYLFPNICDSVYEFSYIVSNDTSFTLFTYLKSIGLTRRSIDTVEIEEVRSNVIKLRMYYKYQKQSTENTLLIDDSDEIMNSNIDLLNTRDIETIKGEYKQTRRLNDDKYYENLRNLDQFAPDWRVEFHFEKKK